MFIYFTSVHVVLVVFVYLVYTESGELGSPSEIYNHLVEVASKQEYVSKQFPIMGNLVVLLVGITKDLT